MINSNPVCDGCEVLCGKIDDRDVAKNFIDNEVELGFRSLDYEYSCIEREIGKLLAIAVLQDDITAVQLVYKEIDDLDDDRKTRVFVTCYSSATGDIADDPDKVAEFMSMMDQVFLNDQENDSGLIDKRKLQAVLKPIDYRFRIDFYDSYHKYRDYIEILKINAKKQEETLCVADQELLRLDTDIAIMRQTCPGPKDVYTPFKGWLKTCGSEII